MNLQNKIALPSIVLIVLGVAAVSFLSSWQITEYLDRRAASQLGSEEKLLADLFTSGILVIDSAGTYDQSLQAAAHTLGVRLTLINNHGVVVYDSQVPRDSLVRLENHGGRPEVLRAHENEPGIDVRQSSSVSEDFLYIARRVISPKLGVLDSGYVRVALPLTEVRSLNDQVQKIIWAVALGTIVISMVVGYYVSRRIARPALEIVETAQAIKNGDLDRRVPVRSNDELGRLAMAINEMADTLSKDIARMRKLEHVRSEFLGNVSHELRTPIFSIQGFLETLLDGAMDDPSVNRDFLEKAHRHAVRLNTLLNDLIEISRIESGDMKMSFRYFPVLELGHHVVDEFRPLAEKKNITLSVHRAVPEGTTAYGDRERIKQVLVNLLDNAVKYSEPGGSVTVAISGDASMCRIAVQDTGPGIDEEHQGRIFERFYRVDKDRSRDVGGTGLGLAIVKHIVEAHGSTIEVTSTVGRGSTFSFTLRG